MRIALGIFIVLAWAGAAHAQDNPACAKYEAPLAYNACLAKLGPKAGVTHATAAPMGVAPVRTRGLMSMTRNRRGRMQAVFAIKGK